MPGRPESGLSRRRLLLLVGYIGAASQFIFKPALRSVPVRKLNAPLFSLLVQGPIYVFAIAVVSLVLAFWFSNRTGAGIEIGKGMAKETFGLGLSAALAMLAGSTGAIVRYLFPTSSET